MLAEEREVGQTNADALVRATLRAAIDGDAQARRLVWECIEGKPRERVELTTTTARDDADDFDLSLVSIETLREFEALYDKAQAEIEAGAA